MKPTIIILTYNSAASIGHTLECVEGLTDDIHIIDSGSVDQTVQIAEAFGAQVHQHAFTNYGAQRNWAIDSLPVKYAWQLHLDADEAISAELREEIAALPETPPCDGYFIARYLRFMGKVLRHNLAPTWHMRLFRSSAGRCEDREYDQHFLATGARHSCAGR